MTASYTKHRSSKIQEYRKFIADLYDVVMIIVAGHDMNIEILNYLIMIGKNY